MKNPLGIEPEINAGDEAASNSIISEEDSAFEDQTPAAHLKKGKMKAKEPEGFGDMTIVRETPQLAQNNSIQEINTLSNVK